MNLQLLILLALSFGSVLSGNETPSVGLPHCLISYYHNALELCRK
jgi:hypothetical protein